MTAPTATENASARAREERLPLSMGEMWRLSLAGALVALFLLGAIALAFDVPALARALDVRRLFR